MSSPWLMLLFACLPDHLWQCTYSTEFRSDDGGRRKCLPAQGHFLRVVMPQCYQIFLHGKVVIDTVVLAASDAVFFMSPFLVLFQKPTVSLSLLGLGMGLCLHSELTQPSSQWMRRTAATGEQLQITNHGKHADSTCILVCIPPASAPTEWR